MEGPARRGPRALRLRYVVRLPNPATLSPFQEAPLGYWQRHPKKEGEDLLREFEAHEWRITRRNRYYMVFCPPSCGIHHLTVHLSPSNPNYFKNVLVSRA